MQEVTFDPAAAREFQEDTRRLMRSVDQRMENALSSRDYCRRRFDQLHDDLRQDATRAQQEISDLRALPEEEASRRDVQQQIRDAEKKAAAAQTALRSLERVWEDHWSGISRLKELAEADYDDLYNRKYRASQTMESYLKTMQEIRDLLQTPAPKAPQAAPSRMAPAFTGWTPGRNRITSIAPGVRGQKTITMTIGGEKQTFSCNKAGMAEAYRSALKIGDEKIVQITSTMFEVETLRESLELGPGDPNVPQLGGYHADVRRTDPKGFESHHIPSNAAQDRPGEQLPTLSISAADHALTSSYRWKQQAVYHSAIPGIPKKDSDPTYLERVVGNLKTGGPGYLHALKCELLELKSTTGGRYDGAISAFLDAVLDMLCTAGIPTPVKKKEE